MIPFCEGVVQCLRFTLGNPFDPIGLTRLLFDPLTILVRIVQAVSLSLFGNPLF